MVPDPGRLISIDCLLCPADDEDGQDISRDQVEAHFRRFHPDQWAEVEESLRANADRERRVYGG